MIQVVTSNALTPPSFGPPGPVLLASTFHPRLSLSSLHVHPPRSRHDLYASPLLENTDAPQPYHMCKDLITGFYQQNARGLSGRFDRFEQAAGNRSYWTQHGRPWRALEHHAP